MTFFQEPVSEKIWDLKYRYRLQNKIIDQNLEATWQRVAKAISSKEKNKSLWQKNFYSILENFHFLPGGRILAGAGTKHTVTLFNCFVMPVSDSLKDIFNALKEGALTLQEGGGIGYDFSVLRPRGSPVTHSGTIASGPVSFMRIWDAMCATMVSTGARRGAMMGVLRCDHPDIEEFIAAKLDPHELRHFNVSVMVSDAFMQAVKKNQHWELIFSGVVYKKIKARALWEKIIKSAYDVAEPGVLFEDTINHQNNLWYREKISATNPCGEIPLPSYGACNLGSINLTQFVKNPYQNNVSVDWKALENTVEIATRFLDNVIDVSKYPLNQQKIQAISTRRMGLGLTGLADFFVMQNIRYGSEASLKLASRVMKLISETTWLTSIELAKERGSFAFFNKKKYLAGIFVKHLPEEIKKNILKKGMRNSHHNTIAPTGTISLLANNVSNGIEPVFGENYQRHIRDAENNLVTVSVTDYALRAWLRFSKNLQKNGLPSAWIDTRTLSPSDHLHMQAAVQPFIDNAISKTINIPENFPFEKLAEIYSLAYELGLKGCTVFRPNPVTGSVLSEVKPEDSADRCCLG
jgi:ribonucleoside-diphosphate reductase alpha chain